MESDGSVGYATTVAEGCEERAPFDSAQLERDNANQLV